MANNLSSLLLIALALIPLALADTQVDALIAFKNTVSDPNKCLTSWDSTLQDPCTWLHVTCNNDNQVTEVNLGKCGLAGPLSPRISELKQLQRLELYENALTGPIPLSFLSLSELLTLDLYNNQITGPLMPWFQVGCPKLRIFRVDHNKLSGGLPLGWGYWLSVFTVGNNNLAGPIPPSYKGMPASSFEGNPGLCEAC